MSSTNDAVREVLAKLEYQAAIVAECKMIEALARLPEDDEGFAVPWWDKQEPESNPADWPAWTDEECWEPGPESRGSISSTWKSWLSRAPLND